MKKLKNKTFLLLVTIFSVFILILIFIFNFNLYRNEYKEIKNNILKIENMHNKLYPNKNDEIVNPLFMDLSVYVVSIDDKNNILSVINYTTGGLKYDEIMDLTKKYLSNKNVNSIGNLYLNKYIYYLSKNNQLIILDNSFINAKLLSSLNLSIILFIFFEIIIIYFSHYLTKWLVKPVEESFIKQKRFICDASHELKTPLSVVMASADMLDDNPNETKWLNNIKSESERMNKLVINLLELAKSEDLNEKEVFNNINLSKLIETSVLSFESLAFENGIKLTYFIEENVMFNCNSDKIRELLGILLDNAIKHTIDNENINVKMYKEKDYIIIEVINKGKEIDKKDREKIFERFYRADESRNRNDNRYGLGLSIAKNIVTSHKGKISVNCADGYTTFKVKFKKK